MPPVPADKFTREFRALPTSERTAFVAALWAARGWETTVEADVVAERDDQQRRIRVVDPGRFGTPTLDEADTLVAARDRDAVRGAASEASVEYVSPTDLYDLLLYGIERETASDLYASTFGQPLERAPPEPESNVDESETERGGVVSSASAALPALSGNQRAVAAILLLVLVGVAVVGPPLPADSPEQMPVTVGDATAGDEQAGAIGGASPSPTEVPGLLPGVTRAGVVDVEALTAAHIEGVSNRSRVQQRELRASPNASDSVVARNLTAWIENESHYRSESVQTIPDENGTSQMGKGLYAANGDLYQRTVFTDGVRYSQFPVSDYPATELDSKVEAYLYRYFAGANDTVVRCAIDYDTDCPTYRIEVDGDPPATLGSDIADYEALAIVSENGVITTIRASYTLPDDDGDSEREPVSFALNYRFEEVTVSAPSWFSEAKNATGTTNETVTPTATPTPTNEPN